MSKGYICRTCGVEHDTIPKAMACFDSHEAAPGEVVEVKEHVLEDAVSLDYPPKAPELLGRAAALMHERGKTYDAPEGERSMGKTVAAFNAITGRDLTESEGWLFMTTLKSVRGFTREEWHRDSFEDLIAYAALMAEAKGKGL